MPPSMAWTTRSRRSCWASDDNVRASAGFMRHYTQPCCLFQTRVNNIEGSNNTIGGATSQARNVISGNLYAGVVIFGVSTDSPQGTNLVQGNYIGTDRDGVQA